MQNTNATQSMEELKIKVVAIAKDEAAYIPQWVFHHINFGFDELEIVINRTTDNSNEVLKKITSKYQKVKISNCDWIDLCSEKTKSNIQELAYANTYAQSLADGFTHILFIDIDEFWTPIDFKTTIKDFIKKTGNKKSISFQWLCELGQDEEFSEIQEESSYFPTCNIKTIIHRDARFSRIRIHTPAFTDKTSHILADGSPYMHDDDEPQRSHPKKLGLKDAFIIHRILRSEREYLSTLIRGNPEDHNIRIKSNRHGFERDHKNKQTVSFSRKPHKEYIMNLRAFIETCGLNDEIERAKNFVIYRAERAKIAIASLSKDDPDTARQVLKGIKGIQIETITTPAKKTTQPDTEPLKKTIKEAFSSLPEKVKSSMDPGEILREAALSFESCHDYETAYRVMHYASELRPSGPLIRAKKDLYASKLKKTD